MHDAPVRDCESSATVPTQGIGTPCCTVILRCDVPEIHFIDNSGFTAVTAPGPEDPRRQSHLPQPRSGSPGLLAEFKCVNIGPKRCSGHAELVL